MIKTRDEIVVGADSFSNIEGHRPKIVCKIGVVDDIVFATAGLSHVFDDVTFENHFTVREIVQTEIKPQIAIEENLRRIIATVEEKTNAYCAIAKQPEKDKFIQSLSCRPIEIILCRYEDGLLKLLAKRLWLKSSLSSGSETIDEIRLAPQELQPWLVQSVPGLEFYVAGSSNAILLASLIFTALRQQTTWTQSYEMQSRSRLTTTPPSGGLSVPWE